MKMLCVALDSYAGATFHPIQIIKETPKRYLVKWLGKSAFQFIKEQEYYVPKYCITEMQKALKEK